MLGKAAIEEGLHLDRPVLADSRLSPFGHPHSKSIPARAFRKVAWNVQGLHLIRPTSAACTGLLSR